MSRLNRNIVSSGSALFGLATLLCMTAGCLNPQTINSATSSFYPVAPGVNPFVAVRVVNESSALLEEVPVTYDDGTNPAPYVIRNLSPQGHDTGVLLSWPVLEVAIGSLSDPTLPSIRASFSDGTTALIPFGFQSLKAGVDYANGDTIIFRITEDTRSPLYLKVSIGRIDGSAQPTTYTRQDPYAKVGALLQESGF